MAAFFSRAAAFAALGSAIGYAAYRYRKRASEVRAERLALEEWETEGGNVSSVIRSEPASAAPVDPHRDAFGRVS